MTAKKSITQLLDEYGTMPGEVASPKALPRKRKAKVDMPKAGKTKMWLRKMGIVGGINRRSYEMEDALAKALGNRR